MHIDVLQVIVYVSRDLPHELGPSALGPGWLRAGMYCVLCCFFVLNWNLCC